MNREVSTYLDATRFLAAFVVLLSHLNMHGNTWLWWALPYGTEAVLVFFVLSGFVIGYVTEHREKTASEYAISRAARIYSVALPALAATVLLDALVPLINHRFHYPAAHAHGQPTWNVLVNALFMSQFWRVHLFPGSNFAFWSLSYEVTYYVAFGVAVFSPARYRLLGSAAILVAAGPRIASLFPIWLLGLGCYRALSCGRLASNRRAGWCVFIGSAVAWVVFEAWATGRGLRTGAALVPLYDHRGWMLLQDYALALLFAANLIGLHAVSVDLAPMLRRVERPVRWLAGTTFTLYLFHLPVSQFLLALLWDPFWSREVQLAVFLGTLGAVFGIAEVTERRKDLWRRGISAMVAGVARALPTAHPG